MLFEIAYPALCLLEGGRRMRARCLGRPNSDFGSDPQPRRFRYLRSYFRRLDIQLVTAVMPIAGAALALWRFESNQSRAPLPPLPIDTYVVTQKGTLALRFCGDPSGARVLLLHGWSANGTMVWPLAQRLADAGFRVVVPDLPGEGASRSPTLSFHEKGRVIAQHCCALGPFECVIGHSAGGLIAAIALEQGLKTDKLVTVSTPQSLVSLLHAYLIRTAAPRRLMDTIPEFYRRIYGVEPRELGPRTFARMGDRLLVAQATGDWQVIAKEAHDILALAPDADALFLDDCNHRTVLNHPTLTKAIIDFVNKDHIKAKADHADIA